jgi:hypothetical protein
MKNTFIFIIIAFLINNLLAQSEMVISDPKYYENIEFTELIPDHHMQSQRLADQHERMEMMKIWKLTEYLSLTETQAEKFFPVMKKHEDNMKKLRSERHRLENEMTERLDASNDPLSLTMLNEFLKDIESVDFQVYEERKAFINRLKNVLSNKQVAKMAMFERHFRGEIRERIKLRRNIDKPAPNRF